MRRPTRLFALAAGLTLLLSGALNRQPIAPGLTQENFDRVRIGMTRPEVEALLGDPWQFIGGGIELESPDGRPVADHPDRGILTWKGEDDDWFPVSVSFDRFGRVSSKFSEVFLVRYPPPLVSPLERIKRQWQKWFP
jgi:hypothetical protein